MRTSEPIADDCMSEGERPSRRAKTTFRLPLDHPETERIAQRLQVLLDLGSLSDVEFGNLMKVARDIKKADHLLARHLYERALPRPPVWMSPRLWDDWKRSAYIGIGFSMVDVTAGWVVNRVAPYVALVEHRHGIECGAYDDI